MDFAFVLGGLALLLIGGDRLVLGAARLGQRLGASPAIIGVVVLGFGTSLPELFTSLSAALNGSAGLAIGNVVGSNIANIALILAAAALIAPIAAPPEVMRRDGRWVAGATLAAAALLAAGHVGLWAALGLIAGLALYLGLALRAASTGATTGAVAPPGGPLPSGWRAGLAAGLGLVAVLAGAVLLVQGATGLARSLGVSETIIGLTLVAVGTSLPELATTLVAVRRGEGALALGNILGSNIFNILGILGITALVAPMDVPPAMLWRDIPMLLAVTGLGLALLASGRGLARREGALLLALYAAYMVWLS